MKHTVMDHIHITSANAFVIDKDTLYLFVSLFHFPSLHCSLCHSTSSSLQEVLRTAFDVQILLQHLCDILHHHHVQEGLGLIPVPCIKL